MVQVDIDGCPFIRDLCLKTAVTVFAVVVSIAVMLLSACPSCALDNMTKECTSSLPLLFPHTR